ncbi:MAG: glycosyltransferase [Cyclobacteriaceae bacterium]|nr:glycosyltransferase [Cyclobacteriaceae bacterium]
MKSKTQPEISVCTVCMNRLHDLRETLSYNLKSADEFSSCEFVLLDYNSRDGLHSWVRENMREYIQSGRLNYYQFQTNKPDYFSHAHSKNIAFKLAEGNILTSVNADHFIEPGFLEYVKEKFSTQADLALISNINTGVQDNFGRLCIKKDNFFKIGGFDESFSGYGYEDTDLSLRLKMAGVNIEFLQEELCHRYLCHKDQERMENTYDFQHLHKIFIQKIGPNRSELFFLYKSNELESGVIHRSEHDIPILEQPEFSRGMWRGSESEMIFQYNDGSERQFAVDKDGMYSSEINGLISRLVEVKDEKNFQDLILKKSLILNYRRLIDRKQAGKYVVKNQQSNPTVFLKNFTSTVLLPNQ